MFQIPFCAVITQTAPKQISLDIVPFWSMVAATVKTAMPNMERMGVPDTVSAGTVDEGMAKGADRQKRPSGQGILYVFPISAALWLAIVAPFLLR